MFSLLAFLLLASDPVVHAGGAVLRSACSTDADPVARLPEGAAVQVRFSISGDAGTCYKVTSGGQTGYVLASDLEGLESYRAGLRTASEIELPKMLRAETARLKEQAAERPDAGEVLALIEANQPRLALEKMENTLKREGRKDPLTLALAGLAAYRSDEPRIALDYWSESQALAPNPSVEALMEKARTELTADTSRNKLRGYRFVLRYNSDEISESTAAEVLAAANDEYTRLDAALGCELKEQIPLVLQNLQAYRATTGAEEWSGGQFDGRIRVVLFRQAFQREARQAVTHELVHACLAAHGRFPHWFHEGMAMRWSGENPGAADVAAVEGLRAPPVLGASSEQARVFYTWSWVAVDRLYRRLGDQAVRALLRNPNSVTASLGN
ncbi:SH3 domain-containing protein [uncultured Paludibaculum sp.]|uniref:SH3 domain-containing protein n=1 Tax=uncultured Paludibaculum sp. TaxID=1765020 RepID=UPI002AABB0D1|nr:SH3 domain-containing protein [uncultured Paludibaculum sp.]